MRLRILLAILLPPLGVFLQVGFGLHFWLNILLTLLGYIPASSTRCGSSCGASTYDARIAWAARSAPCQPTALESSA
jgi:uncharacterized membrane protein YqaE (UPF0057 family)